MFQDFSVKTNPETGAPRLAALREVLAKRGLAGFIVPRADIHQGEYVADRDARLGWLTGFTGSAGFCVVLPEVAGVFIDGRYRVQVRSEVDLAAYTPVNWPQTQAGPWIAEHLTEGRIGFDPWLHTHSEIEAIRAALAKTAVTLVPCDNPIDEIWTDRPAPPLAPARLHPPELAGEASASKRARLAAALAGDSAAVLTQPDSICWLLNIRGDDIARNPLVQSLAILHADGSVDLFAEGAKFSPDLLTALGPDVTLCPPDSFGAGLCALSGSVLVDPASAPYAVGPILSEASATPHYATDPCVLPKARKNAAEVAGMKEAHHRDACAMAEFLAWLDAEAPKGGLTEISVVTALEGFRRATNALTEISFDTICGAGPDGAIVHYRVTEKTDRPVNAGELLLVDSGGQYVDGTTDITRTIAIGPVPEEARAPYTRVLQGMIALSMAQWPKGVAGSHLDALARMPLWQAGQDYDHGTGHGVGAALCVHEGPVRISRASTLPIEEGMILSNEPGYYRDGAFGIRIENLVLALAADKGPEADPQREMLHFETLTWVPIDTRPVLVELLSQAERDWLNHYHATCLAEIGPHVSAPTAEWMEQACAPI
ncbi:aminopeptidase P family protein [Thioclava sp. GXIMD4215]|uniref:aminopeptidase P family protein n=1 Tax=Thioclava sp. GXIMD4215 TaxID=3131928 RepID=UPI00324B0125